MQKIKENDFKIAISKGLDSFSDISVNPNKHYSIIINEDGLERDVTLLSYCSEIANYECVKKMLDLGADPNELVDGYRQKYTALHMVIYGANGVISELGERKNIISILIEKGADIHYRGNDIYSWPPLAVADWKFSKEAFVLGEHLIRYGVDWKIISSAESSKAAAIDGPSNPSVTPIRYLLSGSESFRLFACKEALKVLSTSKCELSSKLAESTVTSLKNVAVSYNDGEIFVMGDNDYKFDCNYLFELTDISDILKSKLGVLDNLTNVEGFEVHAKIFEDCQVIDVLQKFDVVESDISQSGIDEKLNIKAEIDEGVVVDNLHEENAEIINDTFFSSMTKFVCEYTGFFC